MLGQWSVNGRLPPFRSNSDRIKHRALVDETVGAWFATRTREDALQLMRDANVTVGPVYSIADAMVDPHFREREIIVAVEDGELGRVPMHNIVPRLSETPGAWRDPRRFWASKPMPFLPRSALPLK